VTIIAGGRDIEDKDLLLSTIKKSKFEIDTVVSGMCRGVDQMGIDWARENAVPVIYKPAEWDKYGKSAGPIRNKDMAILADSLILIWDGNSNGSFDMLRVAKGYGLTIYEKRTDL